MRRKPNYNSQFVQCVWIPKQYWVNNQINQHFLKVDYVGNLPTSPLWIVLRGLLHPPEKADRPQFYASCEKWQVIKIASKYQPGFFDRLESASFWQMGKQIKMDSLLITLTKNATDNFSWTSPTYCSIMSWAMNVGDWLWVIPFYID